MNRQSDGLKLRKVEPLRRKIKMQSDDLAALVDVDVQPVDDFASLDTRRVFELDI